MTHDSPAPRGGNTRPTAREELEARLEEIEAANHLLDPYAFSSRTLIQTTFPHSSKAGDKLVLKNGALTVTMISPNGLPYGVYPRLIMCWLTREALRRRDLPEDEARTIPLGSSLADFMRDVGITGRSGGRTGNITSLRKQLRSLFTTMITAEVVDHESRDKHQIVFDQMQNTLIAESSMLWWDTRNPEQLSLQDSSVTLTAGFYRELTCSAVPLDVAILREIRRSPMAIDLYCWMTYRASYQRGITVVTWDQLRRQFGAGYQETPQGKRDFKKKLLEALEKVVVAWPEAAVDVTENGLMLRPGAPSVPRRVHQEITKRYATGADNRF